MDSKIFACCGHEVTHDQKMKTYWWRESVIDYDEQKMVEALASGPLCPQCARDFGAVQANSYEEAMKALED